MGMSALLSFLVCLLLPRLKAVDGFTIGFIPRQSRHRFHQHEVRLKMAYTPIGPFCPFRSSTATEIDKLMENLQTQMQDSPDFTIELKRIQLQIEVGETPDQDRLLTAADTMEAMVREWEDLMANMENSSDFQTREFAKFTHAQLDNHGVNPTVLAKLMKWQGGCLRSMALNTPPPMPPVDVDLTSIMKSKNGSPPPSMTSMSSAEMITASPFDTAVLEENPLIAEEHTKLCQDHANLIEFGLLYDSFDPAGKVAYINEIEKIEDRWDVFFARFGLMGKLDHRFTDQCNAFLQSMSLDEQDFKTLLKKTHELMKEEAERERM